MIKRIDHLVIRSSDIDETTRFYCALGFKISKNGEKYALCGNDFKINVHLKDDPSPRRRTGAPHARVCFEVDGSLPQLVNTMKALGYRPESDYAEKTGALGPMLSCYFRDPDNNLVELCSYREEKDLRDGVSA